LKNLSHPNVVRAVELFSNEFKNEIYQVMEFIDG